MERLIHRHVNIIDIFKMAKMEYDKENNPSVMLTHDTSTATAMPLPFSAVASVGAKRLPQASSALYTREAFLLA